MSKHNSLQKIIEGALMGSHEPLTLQEIANLFDENKPSKNEIKKIIDKLNENYVNNAFEIIRFFKFKTLFLFELMLSIVLIASR